MNILTRQQPATTRPQQPVRINSEWFRKGYARGIAGTRGLPLYPTESAIVGIVQNILAMDREDQPIDDNQLQYECGLLVGYLIATVG